MIRDNEFDLIWDAIVEPLLIQHAETIGLQHKPFFWVKWRLKRKFDKHKELSIKTYMKLDTTNIDRHKISACFMKSILQVSPLYIPIGAKLKFIFTKRRFQQILPHKLSQQENEKNKYFLFFNENLAISVSVAILNSYINSDDRPGRFKHDIVIPEPFPEADTDYLRDLCIGLHYSKTNKLNVITIANLMFMWEKYSCRKTQCDNIIESYRDFLKKLNMSNEDIDSVVENAKYSKHIDFEN